MAAETAKRQCILQEEQLARYVEQQAALLRVQAEIGSEAAKVHREEVAASKARDRAIASVRMGKTCKIILSPRTVN